MPEDRGSSNQGQLLNRRGQSSMALRSNDDVKRAGYSPASTPQPRATSNLVARFLGDRSVMVDFSYKPEVRASSSNNVRRAAIVARFFPPIPHQRLPI